jgi:hypothetical protein
MGSDARGETLARRLRQAAPVLHRGRPTAPRTSRQLRQPVPDAGHRLVPAIGYDKASVIAHTANDQGITLREAALASGYISAADFDRIVNPAAMAGRREATVPIPRTSSPGILDLMGTMVW